MYQESETVELKYMIGRGQIVQEGRSRNTHYRLAE